VSVLVRGELALTESLEDAKKLDLAVSVDG
jgi:hypothetical protein